MTEAATKKRRHKTYARLILVAERLFAYRGVEAVSMRQIGEAAEIINNSVVQYHFGDKASLIRAIFEHRQPYTASRRRVLLKQAQLENRLTPRDLLEVLLRPLTEIVDEDGAHVYARFVWQLQRPDTVNAQPFQVPPLSSRQDEIAILLHAALDHLPSPLFHVALRAAVSMFLYMLISRDELRSNMEELDDEIAFQHSLDMVAAALTAPFSPDLRKKLG